MPRATHLHGLIISLNTVFVEKKEKEKIYSGDRKKSKYDNVFT
jgi:hypothetical protein